MREKKAKKAVTLHLEVEVKWGVILSPHFTRDVVTLALPSAVFVVSHCFVVP